MVFKGFYYRYFFKAYSPSLLLTPMPFVMPYNVSNNLRYADNTTLIAEGEKELKNNWWESEKVGLKLNIQKTKIMASGPITSWQIDGETLETVRDFILGGSKITADGDLQPWN